MGASEPRAATSATRRGWSLLGGAFGLIVGGILLGHVGMLVLGVAALLLLGALTVLLSFTRVPESSVERRIRPDRLHVGSDGRIDITVENHGRRTTPLLHATDWFDEGRRAARFLVPPLATGARARAAYRIPTRRRGRYVVGPLVVSAVDPFGLVRRVLPGTGEVQVIVRPRVYDIAPPVAAGSRMAADGETVGSRAIASDLGDDFLTLRQYEVGDDLRRVHWRATARAGELMIRHNEARWRSRAAVLLDVRPGAHDAVSFEVAVEAAASVVARLVRLRRRVEVITSAGEVLGTGGDPRHDVIDRLATVGLDDDDRIEVVAANLRAHRQADLVIAIVGTVDPDARRALAALVGQQLVVVLTRGGAVTSAGSVTTVDASAQPFPVAWNQAFVARSRASTDATRIGTWARGLES